MPRKAAKSRKQGWKKVDATEVEDYLEDERLQERTGGLVAEKKDDQLFFIDKPPPSTNTSAMESKKETQKRGMAKNPPKQLKCFANLEPDQRIPAISKSTPDGGTKRMLRNSTVAKKVVKSLKNRKATIQAKESQRAMEKVIHQETYDLWAEDGKEAGVDKHFAVVTKRKRVKVPKSFYKKPSALAAVEVPHPGSSYNPAFDDHQELLHQAVSVQVKEDLRESKMNRRMNVDYGAEGRPTQETYLKEMSQGLGLNPDSDAEESAAEEDSETETKPSSNKIKTRKQRRKQMKAKQQEQDRLKAKEERIREDKDRTDKIKSIHKEVLRYEDKLATRAALRQAKKDTLAYTTRRLHNEKFQPTELDVLMTSELTGSLRLAKSCNTLMDDRFKSIQKRNIIEPRSKTRHKRQRQVKFTEKKQYKEITMSSRAGGGIIIPYKKAKHDDEGVY